jgi:hypothetical protein
MNRGESFLAGVGLAALFIGCGMSLPAHAEEWKTSSYSISGSKLTLQLPDIDSADFPMYRPLSHIDLNDPGTFKESGSVQLDQKFWDYFQFLHFGPVGTLHFQILVRVVRDEDRFDPKDLNAAGKASMAEHVRGWTRFQSEIRKEHHIEWAIPEFAVGSAIKNVGRTSWYFFQTLDRSNPSTYCYVKGLDETHVIELTFTYIDNTMDNDLAWRKKADRTIEKVLGTARLTEKM